MGDKVHSVSSISKYDKCPALYALHYHHFIREEDKYKDSRDRGSCVHADMEAWLRAYQEEPALRNKIAQEAAYKCESDGSIDDNVRNEAAEIIAHYIHQMPPMTPVLHKGKPMLEFEFKEAFKKYGVSIQGKIDAVVTLEDGRTALLDWKVRGSNRNFYRPQALRMDRQLPVYAAVLKHVYGITVDVAYQVQMSAALPAVPRPYAGKEGNTAEEFVAKIGPTTSKTLQQVSSALSEDEQEAFMLRYFDKVTSEDEFLAFSEVDLSNVDKFLHYTLMSAARINRDKDFLPILDAYVCKFCPVATDCHMIYLDMVG